MLTIFMVLVFCASALSHPAVSPVLRRNHHELAEAAVRFYNKNSSTDVQLIRVVSVHHGKNSPVSSMTVLVKPLGCEECSPQRCQFTIRDGHSISGFCGRPGGFKPVPSDDTRVLAAARYGVEDLNRISNCLYQYKLVTVNQAQLKVEDGNDFFLNITTCMYNPNDESAENPCKKIHPEIIQYCDLNVLVHPWEARQSVLTNFKCTGCA